MKFLPLVLAVLVWTSPATVRAENDDASRRVNAALVETHVLPRYERLAAATGKFANAATAFCNGMADLAAARSGFHETMDAWMAVRHLRFGPVELSMRVFRFYFWPQARGKVAGAIRAVVEDKDDAASIRARIDRTNAALQGLLAAEVLLYGEPRADRDAPGCDLLEAATGNMRVMAEGVLAEWRDGDEPFARIVTTPGNANFADHREATLAFFKSLHDGLQFVADAKLKPVVGAAAARPRLAESRLSGRSLRNVVQNLEALQALYVGEGEPGLGALARVADPKLDRLMRKAFRITIETARAVGIPLEEAAANPSLRPAAKKLAIQVQALRQIARDRVAPALGFSVGFNALDGD